MSPLDHPMMQDHIQRAKALGAKWYGFSEEVRLTAIARGNENIGAVLYYFFASPRQEVAYCIPCLDSFHDSFQEIRREWCEEFFLGLTLVGIHDDDHIEKDAPEWNTEGV